MPRSTATESVDSARLGRLVARRGISMTQLFIEADLDPGRTQAKVNRGDPVSGETIRKLNEALKRFPVQKPLFDGDPDEDLLPEAPAEAAS